MVTRRGVIALAGVAALVVVAWPVGLAGWAFAAGNLLVLAAIAADWLAAEPARSTSSGPSLSRCPWVVRTPCA